MYQYFGEIDPATGKYSHVRITADDGTTQETTVAEFERDPEKFSEGIREPVPDTVSSAQARVALLAAGKLDSIEAIMATPEIDPKIKIFWEYETVFWRLSPAINALSAQLGLSSDELDELFRQASKIIV